MYYIVDKLLVIQNWCITLLAALLYMIQVIHNTIYTLL